jgi:hypothetical protein
MRAYFAIFTNVDFSLGATQLSTRDEWLEALLRQVARGNETAFAELYDQICHMVSGLVLLVLGESRTFRNHSVT